jgi:pimeloyl-ACP methyl ester carboxylesterase
VIPASTRAENPAAHVDVSGEGPPLLFLHGWGVSSELFKPLVPLLSAARRLIVPDLPGFGGTPPPAAAWSVSDFAAWTVALLDRLAVTRCDVIGHSNGGRIALMLAARHPDRINKVVVTGGAGIRPSHGLRYQWRVRTYKTLRLASRTRLMPPALRGWAASRADRRGSVDYRAASGVMRETLVRIVNEDLRPLLPAVKRPVLLIWGERDTETPLPDGRLMERLIPDAGLVVFEGAGHYAYLEQPARFARIVNVFLSDAEDTGS